MPSTIITLGGNPVLVVALPPRPGLRSITFDVSDAVAIVTSPLTGQTQAQQWPGADMWTGTLELLPLREHAPDWEAFLMELRGKANAFQAGDPMYKGPRGTVFGSNSVPLADMTVPGNGAGATTLNTRGWSPAHFRLLLPGDALQLGYRLHRVLDVVDSDATGHAGADRVAVAARDPGRWPAARAAQPAGPVAPGREQAHLVERLHPRVPSVVSDHGVPLSVA